MADIEFPVNYYALLALDPELDAAAHRALIGEKIAQRQQEWKQDADSFDTARKFDARLGLASVKRMKADLRETPPAMWAEHALLRRKELAAAAVQRAVAATEYFDLLGDVALNEETRVSIEKLVGDARLVGDVVAMRKLVVTREPAPDADADTYKRVMGIRQALAPILARLGHDTVYGLIGALSGVAVTSATEPQALSAALGRLDPNTGPNERRKVVGALYDAMTPLVQPDDAPAGGASAGGPSAVKRLFDELQRFDKAAHLELFLSTTFRALQLIDVGQFDRLCALARKHTGLDDDTVRRHFRTLCRVWKITQPQAVTATAQRFQVCAFCAALSPGDARHCASCAQALFEQCINCGAGYAAVARRCPSCGTGDAACATARASLTLGRAHLAADELALAQAHLDTARTAAPLSKEVHALAAAIESARRQLAGRLGELDRLIAGLHMHAAHALLAPLARAVGEDELRHRATAIAAAIERADALTARARGDIARAAYDAATGLLGQALAQAADHEPARRALDSIAPPAPTGLVARHDGQRVQLSWQAPALPAWQRHGFRLVRAVGHAPSGPGDGELVCETAADGSGHAFADTGCPVASPVHYAVFSTRAQAHCAQPARAGPVLLLPPVADVRIARQDRGLRFDWSAPPRAQDTAIYRLGLADDLAAALARPPDGIARGEWVDADIVEGRPMRYAFVARYAVDGRIVGAEPLLRDTLPAPAPTPLAQVQDLGGARIAWRPAPLADETDELFVFDAASPRVPAPDAIVHAEDLPEPLQRLRTGLSPQGQALHLFGEHLVVVVRRRGELARCAKALRLRHLPAVEALTLAQNERGVEARWGWPDGCTRAALRLSRDGVDLGTHQVERVADEAQGACAMALPGGADATDAASPGMVSVVVTACSRDGRFASEPCTAQTHLRAKNTLSFKVSAEPARASRGWFGGVRAATRGPTLQITLAHPEPLPAFELRFSAQLLPRRHEGRQLMVTAPGAEQVQAAEIALAMLEGERGFVNLWLLDPAEAARITVVPLAPRL
uniref:zinc ribbon domain-containing protein n=1 Tax=unclassified Variovorax TaxID=663243 RepID=UPI000D34399A